MMIDCDRCEVRGHACGDCVVTVLLGSPPDGVVFDHAERAAIGVLAEAGLVPPLRLVTSATGEGGVAMPERDGSAVSGCESRHPPAADTG